MTISREFDRWRSGTGGREWGLAWFLASEFCRRFHVSHGVMPRVLNHEGLGYYGIGLQEVDCKVASVKPKALGRLIMTGNVENWRTGEPGDHGLKTEDMCLAGASEAAIVEAAIRHMALPPMPAKSHVGCRHQRRGASYVMCFEIATIIALRHACVAVTNAPEETVRLVTLQDPKAAMHEHPGAFLMANEDRQVLLIGDGRLMDESGVDLWKLYMQGRSIESLVGEVETRLGLQG